MLRRLLMAGLVLLGSASASFGQYTQQRQDDPGVVSVPPTAPLQIPATQSPVITNPALPTQQQVPQLQQLQQQQRQQAQPAAKPAAEPVVERNEFQLIITASTGKKLPIFGSNLF